MIERTAPEPHFYQYATPEQHRDAARLGMWAILAGEIMLFAALTTVVVIYRVVYAAAFAQATRPLNLSYGLAGVLVLVLAGLFMGLATSRARSAGRGISAFLVLAILLGIAFIVIKGFELADLASRNLVPGATFALTAGAASASTAPPSQSALLFALVIIIAGVFILHVVIGIVVALADLFLASERHFTPRTYLPLDFAALFWQGIVLAAVVLFPFLYLIGRA